METITLSRTDKIKPFNVPNYAVPENGGEGGIQLSDIPATTLARMCDEWREAVFAKANKPDPTEPRQ